MLMRLSESALDAEIIRNCAYLMTPRKRPGMLTLVYSPSWCDPSNKPHAILRLIGAFADPVLACGVRTSV